MPKRLKLFLIFSLILYAQSPASPPDTTLYAGFRGSRIRPYSAQYWQWVGDSMSRSFTRPAAQAGIWILSFYVSNGNISVQFPSNGNAYPYMSFASTDYNEPFLNYFDAHGLKVWLQVEPGAANMDTLINLVFRRYGHHPCVIGFGVDVEWLDTHLVPGGRQVTNAEAQRWESNVRSFDTTYALFLKHYTTNRMPPSYRGNILFVDDSQQHGSFNSFVNEFRNWGNFFATNKVAFQFGYAADSTWWRTLPNPPQAIGNALLAAMNNVGGLFWVDFTITRVFPPSALSVEETFLPSRFSLDQNYPNPFNPETNIKFSVEQTGRATLEIFNLLGQKVATLFDNVVEAGYYQTVRFNGANLASGMYFYRLQSGKKSELKKLILLR